MTRQTNEAKAGTSSRPKRTPVGSRPRLIVHGKNPNFEYRIVNDTPGNVALYTNNGWQACTNEEVDTGNFRADQGSEIGSLAYFIVDSGTGMKGYVLKISKDEYQEIQDAYEEINRASEETMMPNQSDGEYGRVSIDRSGRR
jgi:hypothetical protein